MKPITIITTFILFLLSSPIVLGQTTDTTKQSIHSVQGDTLTTTPNTDQYRGTDDFSPMQLFFVLILLGVVLLLIGGGIVLTVTGLFIIFGLVSAGILSTSIVVGLYKKSFMKGFKTLIVLASTIIGLLAGVLSFWLIHKIINWLTTQASIISGAACGLLGGFVFGHFAFYILRGLTTYFKQKLKLTVV